MTCPPRLAHILLPIIALLVLGIAGDASTVSAKQHSRTIDVASPREGATLRRTAVFKPRMSKAQKRRTSRVELLVDGVRVAVDSSRPFHVPVDTTKLSDGEHVFRVRAVVRTGRKARSSRARRARVYSGKISATVSNARKARPTTPAAPKPDFDPTPDPRIGQITNPHDGWDMVFSDEFDGTSLDMSKWNNQRDDWLKGGVQYSNLEGAWYMPANTTVENGALKQTIRKESSNGFDYTTGMVNTNKRFAFTYGYVEARMKVPACSGCWPAFWMLPSKIGWPPEIDIYEFFDSANLRVPYFSSHWKVPTADQEYVTNPFGTWGGDYTESWHTYGMLWTPDSVQVFLDGAPGPKYTDKAVPHEDMYLIIQAAIGKGYATPDGANLQTDYVRVYQQPAA